MKSLDMSAFTVRGVNGTKLGASNSHLYDLAAVIVHHGSGYALTSLFMLILLRKVESNLFYLFLYLLLPFYSYIFIYLFYLSYQPIVYVKHNIRKYCIYL